MTAQPWYMKVALALCALAGVSALVVGVMALLQVRAAWVMFGFEVVVLVAAVLGARIALGRPREGPALGLVCVAGTILVGTAFGYIGGGRLLYGMDIRPLVYARAAIAAGIMAIAGVAVLGRDPSRSMPAFIRGCIAAAPIPVLALAAWQARARIAHLPDVAQLGLVLVGFTIFTGCLAASVHLWIKAFDAGVRKAEELDAGQPA